MQKNNLRADIVLIGAGIMSGTLGILLKELNPLLSIVILEKLDAVGLESSDAWNNAGTGHSAFCELNYTPMSSTGHVDISKAIKIATAFERSKEFWSYLVENKQIIDPETFIQKLPHMSFVWGDENIAFLKQRHEQLTDNALFCDMSYSDSWEEISRWMPLIMDGRVTHQSIAATRMDIGTDVNFGSITRAMFKYLGQLEGVTVYTNHQVEDIYKNEDHWYIESVDLANDNEQIVLRTPYAFIGAGGGTLPLLEKSNILEAEGYGGFPISGQWLICQNQSIIKRHWAKVYGKAEVGSPPMSVPHLDTRFINGQQALLFGPFAGFSTKFLKHGSFWDLPSSIELDNIKPMISAGLHNLPLTKYLIHQLSLSHEDRINELKKYMPLARSEEWELGIAGQRVQVIKRDDEQGGMIEFGTEIVCSHDGSIAGLLGASPGASTALSIMVDVLKKGFAKDMIEDNWIEQVGTWIPSFHQSIQDDEALVRASRNRTSRLLGLE